MNVVLWLLDIVLSGSLIGLAWQIIMTRGLFNATVLFIVFGFVMALAWTRLNAPDIALVEVAVGAGLTGALLLTTLAEISEAPSAKRSHTAGGGR